MPRRKSTNAAPAPTPKTKSHKRTLSSSAIATPTATAASTPGSRASKRLKESAPSTAKKSKYFEGADSDEDDQDPTSADDEASDFNDADDTSAADASPSPSASEDEEEEAYESDEDREKPNKPNKRGRQPGRKPTAAQSGAAGIVSAVVGAGKELWRAGVKTGLGPGKQVFIERPKPRGDGGIKYVPGRIHPNTMAFLADLKKNNDREWLKSECASWLYVGCIGVFGRGRRPDWSRR
jgi:hypothetical protein